MGADIAVNGFPMLTLAGLLPSPFVRKVCVVLAEKNVDYRMFVQGASWPDTRIPEFNPLGKIPVLIVDDKRTLFDSRVIVEYIDGIAPAPRLIPDDFDARIDVRRWEALADGACDAAVAIVAENRRVESERSATFIAKQAGKVERAIAEMARSLGDRDHCVGDSLTLADIAGGVALAYIDYRMVEIPWRSQYPALARFADAMHERPSFQRTRNDPSRQAPELSSPATDTSILPLPRGAGLQ